MEIRRSFSMIFPENLPVRNHNANICAEHSVQPTMAEEISAKKIKLDADGEAKAVKIKPLSHQVAGHSGTASQQRGKFDCGQQICSPTSLSSHTPASLLIPPKCDS